jgi:hypothetical protein
MLAPLFLMACAHAQNIEPDIRAKERGMKIQLMAGEKRFIATLCDNEAARAFVSRLPMTIEMREMNGNEKYHELPQRLPGKAAHPGTIHAGDIMLWSSNTVVLFYETFFTSYDYVRIGRVDDPTGLAAALGAGSVKVTLEQAGRDFTGQGLDRMRENSLTIALTTVQMKQMTKIARSITKPRRGPTNTVTNSAPQNVPKPIQNPMKTTNVTNLINTSPPSSKISLKKSKAL